MTLIYLGHGNSLGEPVSKKIFHLDFNMNFENFALFSTADTIRRYAEGERPSLADSWTLQLPIRLSGLSLGLQGSTASGST
jgi:hypothetical protein